LQAVIQHRHHAAQPPPGVAHRQADQLQVADVFVGDLMRGALPDHIADRLCQRRAQGDERGDFNFSTLMTLNFHLAASPS
jgi:hypothetical protein